MNEPILDTDRRAHPRVPMSRPGKIFDPRSGKYHPAELRDLSHGGMLLDLPHLRAFRPGDVVLVGLAEKRREPLLKRQDMIRAEVVRSLGTPCGRTLIAVEFLDRNVAHPHLDELIYRRAA